MKKGFLSPLVFAVLFTLLFLGAGCSKKTVIPPENSGAAGADAGKNIKYPLSESGFNQDSLPRTGTLDDKQMANTASYADSQSDEYKRLHGRCSENLFPVYFDFDQAGIRPDMVPVVTRNAEYLKSVPNARIILEGNSDERGTNEYNMALGERRAINVQQYLTNMGIDAGRMQTLSYGEERPLFLGHDEDAYSGNRRVDLILK